MFRFNKKEITGIVIILLSIVGISYVNILISYRNDRDTRRNLDISTIAIGLEKYRNEYGIYPLSSEDGKIVACIKGDEKPKPVLGADGKAKVNVGYKKALINNYTSCQWGKDFLGDVTDINYPKYLDLIPQDPGSQKGRRYFYKSDGVKYMVFAAYEGKLLNDYSKNVVKMNIDCGKAICNVGRSIGANPIE